jgi:predicted small secreted protein
VWEKFKFQLRECFNGSCCGLKTHLIVKQKNQSNRKPLRLLQSTKDLPQILVVLMPSDQKKSDHSALFYNGAIGKQ